MIRDAVSELKLTDLLQNEASFSTAYCYESVTSTNDVAKELAKKGAAQGTVILAGSQTKGRGRMGRQFYSPGQTGLYMSLVLRPRHHQQDAGLLTACGAVAVHQAILELTGIKTDIKWVNDLYYQKSKLCGILAESQFAASGEFAYVILGIGVNLAIPDDGFPDEIRGKATSLAEICSKVPDKEALCAAVVRHWFRLYDGMPCVDFLQVYREASCVLNENISYVKEGKKYTGKAVSIDERARLLVLCDNGVTDTLETGEVTMVRPII